MKRKPRLAVFKLASCDGCQLTLLDCERELLALSERVEIASFPEASSRELPGPYDVALVEGSITTPRDAELIVFIRARSRLLVTLGACANAGGIQALRNYARMDDFLNLVYAQPQYIDTLERATPVAEHVKVDYALHGCPIDKVQLLEVLTALLAGRKPRLPGSSVCQECKRRGTICLMTGPAAVPCLGPITREGCGAICPSYERGCFGCFGPCDTPNTASLADQWRRLGADDPTIVRALRTFNPGAFES